MRNHNEDEGTRSASSRKRRKKIDHDEEGEERLQKMEALHLRRRMTEEKTTTSVSSTSSSSDSASGTGESEDNDGALSASTSEEDEDEDAVYGEKVDPAFDLMKTMLRNSYTGKNKDGPVVEEKEKNVELEVGKDTRTLNVDGGEEPNRKQLKDSVSGGSGGVDVKGKEGPRFRDLGGMREVLEELKMEVIVPLCHPQLPRQLGVRPMAGILLHGPPGCGKTRLAHAIANETGLPFYSISATEVVSGVSGNCF